MTDKTPFVHTLEFNVSLIIAFFQAFVGAIVIVTVVALHAAGTAVAAEIVDRPAVRIEAPRSVPIPAPEPGIPVALTLGDGR